MTTIINTHDMNSVMGIGENICFIYQGHKEWQGNKDEVMTSTNEKLNDLVFASDLFRKVKEVELEEAKKQIKQYRSKKPSAQKLADGFFLLPNKYYLIFQASLTSTIGTTICSLVLSPYTTCKKTSAT